jgi:osmoprotectant transport system permease protein
VREHWGDILQPALIQHVELTVIAVGIGFAIAFVLALAGFRWRLFDPPLGAFTDFLYTIPSLALYQLLVPLTGLTVTTIEVALVSYTLFVLYRNIVAGLRAVPDDVLESARGMGLTRLQTFVRVELPLATPAILAGVRVATVSTISIATVGAFLLDYGLGGPIFDAVGQPDIFRTALLAAGGLTILLALTADALLTLLQRALTPWSRLR